MNKKQFMRQYVMNFMSSVSAGAIAYAAIYEKFDIMREVGKTEVLSDQTDIAYILAERTWEQLLEDGVIDLEDE
jgi:hypothetical protein